MAFSQLEMLNARMQWKCEGKSSITVQIQYWYNTVSTDTVIQCLLQNIQDPTTIAEFKYIQTGNPCLSVAYLWSTYLQLTWGGRRVLALPERARN